MDVRKLWNQGINQLLQTKERVERERPKGYRGGNSGLLFEDGMVAGSCHRETLARYLGWFNRHSKSRQLMFKAGERNEDTWMEILSQSDYKGAIRKCDNMVEWKTRKGTPVTGSPDIVFFDEREKPVHFLELKHVSSFHTARNVMFKDKPGLAHLIQSTHYMAELGLDSGDLIYTNSINLTGPEWASFVLPKPWEVGSEVIDYTYYYTVPDGYYVRGKNKGKPKEKKEKVNIYNDDVDLPWEDLKNKYPSIKSGDFKNISPFFVTYQLKLDREGSLLYLKEGQDEWVETVVSVDRIRNFYDYLDEMQDTQLLGPRPINITATSEDESYSKCDYCPLKRHCDKYENNYHRWLEAVLTSDPEEDQKG